MIDLLTTWDSESAFFDVDTGLASVNMQYPVSYFISTATGNRYFTRKDNFTILSIGIVLPLSFEFLKSDYGGGLGGLAQLSLYWINEGGIIVPLNNFQMLNIPFFNYEFSLGKYYQIPDILTTPRYEIWVTLQQTSTVKISMLGVPASLHGQRFYCPIFLKLLHSIEIGS
jgi:hypothetical protein